MLQKYTVDNKNIDRQEKIQRRSLPHLRKIKLYSRELYIPIWQHWYDTDSSKHKLTQEFIYNDNIEWIPQDIIDEQNYVMLQIGMWGLRTGLIEMKTGRGKWNLILKMIAEFQEKCLILVHNQKTLKELKEKFEKFSNTTPWEWWSSKKNMQEVMITTHKSFVQNTAMFTGKFGVIFYDEADVNLSNDMITALAVVDAEGLFGLTGTPKRQELDLNDLQLIYWPHIKLAGQDNNWYNLIPNIVQLRYSTTVCSFDSFHDLKEQLMTEQDRLKKQQDFVKYVNEKMWVSLFLVSRVEECRIYHELFDELKIPNVIVNWKTKLADDEKNIRQMVEQKWIIVATAQKMWRGIDIPEVQAVFLFYPTRFEGNVVQSVWRALRSHPSKEKVYLFDWVDDTILSGQGYERKKTYYKEYHWCVVKELKIGENSFIQP